ncbi:uncharacterized protein LOC120460460 [Pimephales promelas]|uniref:uncharacterized protein LOC120460460 n=1 Tax=Pimephales promelas TaxID=90988 RepID=UPI0019555D73|nr:uncharacterized protein LOC120460460 [Pimephales promelas]
MTVTTIQHYILNVGCFMRFLSETPPQSCRLTKKALVGLRREMGALRKSLKRGVAVHQTQVKEVNIIQKPTLRKCRELTAKAIPDLLNLLENEPTQKTLWRFYEYFAALLASVYGHRERGSPKHNYAGGSGGPQIDLGEGVPDKRRQPQDEHGFRVGPDRFDGGVQLGQSTPPSQTSAPRRTLRQVPVFHFDFLYNVLWSNCKSPSAS